MAHKLGTVLTPEGLLASDLWIDRPDALSEVERRSNDGRLEPALAEPFRQLIERGYLTLDLELPERTFTEIESCVDRLWRERPANVGYAFEGLLRPMNEADEAKERRPPARIVGLESECPAALDLYLHPRVFAVLHQLFEDRAVATQSIYFQFGSRQQLHRDPVHVVMRPPSHLFAAWFALEDIRPDSGPLMYVPGSHRLPYFQFEPGVYLFDHYKHTGDDANRMAAFELAQCERAGLAPEPFLPRRGQVLIWHHSLLHGGSPGDERVTRKSFVVHYTTMRHYRAPQQTVSMPGENGARRLEVWESFDVLAREGRYGFTPPMRGHVAR